jgi:phospholipid-binding lipoprotein MlaA
MSSIRTGYFCLLAALTLAACASNPATPQGQRSAADPWEPMNRQFHGFNTGLDKITLKPVAKGYQAAVPRIIRTGIGNFSANLRTPLNIINQFLQGKGRGGLSETGRFLANSTFGLGGLLDVATDMGLEAKDEDFGETLAVWGIPDGPYVVLPFMGPGTLRDTLAMPLNILADPLYHYENASVRDKLYVVRTIDLRASLFSGERLIEGSADKYLALREAYLQNRRYRIHDGDPPEDDDFYDEFIDDDATQ